MDEIRNNDQTPKKSHPIERANPLSRLFFCWLLPYFVRGLRKEIDEDDMYATRKSDKSSRLGDKLEAAWKEQLEHNKDPSLFKALFKVFRWEFLFYVFFHAFNETMKLAQPLLISKLLEFYDPTRTDLNKEDSYIYAGLILLSISCTVLGIHNYQLQVMAMGMDVRVATCSLIYRKALRLSKSSLAETTIGQMVNLLSNDVSRFDFVAQHINALWIAPVETAVIMYLLYVYVGPSGLVGAVFLLLFIPFQMYMGKRTSVYRLRTAIRTDERVRLMNEIISGIQVIKMYTWEKPFSKLVELSRIKEIQQIRATSTIRAIMMSCNIVLSRAAIYLCILYYILTGNVINASYVYTIISFYGVLRNAVTMFFPQAITQYAEASVSVNRIKKFLLYEETDLEERCDVKSVKYLNGNANGSNIAKSDIAEVGINMSNISVRWLSTASDYTLGNIDFRVSSNQLVAIVGPVGGGKTTLLHAILQELPPQKGIAEIHGTMSYASQEPWLFGGSVRQNILFGQEFDQKRYEEVVRVCALKRDFTLFPDGDRTLVGERGVTLSGGQRARINLARAVYKEADIYLLDDPLSAVDTHVGKQLFDQCICGYLGNKCVVLVTHQLQYLRNVSQIYLLENGMVTLSGTYQELKSSDTQFTKLLSESKDEEVKEMNGSNKLSVNSKKDSLKIDEDFKPVLQEKEYRATGTISKHVYLSFFKAGGHMCKTIILLFSFLLSQILGSSTDYFLTLWVNYQQWKVENKWNETAVEDDLEGNITPIMPPPSATPVDDIAFKSIQDFLFGDYTIYVYSVLIAFTTVVTVARSIGFFRFCLTISRRMHNDMFNKIVFSPMRFFNTNASGRILNRFSKDIGALDETLPITLVDTIQIGLTVCAISIVVGTLNPWIFLPTLIMLTIFYFIRRVFLASSRNIKRVEAVTRSPVYTHLTATLQGLTTIRAFKAQEILTVEFDNYQDASTSAYYMFLTANRSFGFWLDFHCVIYIGFIISSLLFMKSESFGGNIGLALTQSMTLTGMFQWGMRQWSELENQMTSVERVQEYADLQPELDDQVEETKKDWPQNGALEFRNMFLRYSQQDNYVLKNLNFVINPREKVGIVGRTGAGKSSIIQALFRLADISGDILIDGVDTKTVQLRKLRSCLSIIPQEPVLFSGTLRKNLDPFDEYNDDALWSALEDVELKSPVEDLPSGLNNKMAEGGSNFSVGQRQLLCLARSIVRNNKILVLDEATANVDPHTDALIQQTIRRKFAQCTVLTVAHRLHTIMDSDKVIVMDAGRVMEFDHPYLLLQNKEGAFYKLVMQTGSAMAESLIDIAKENYNKNR